MSLMFTLKFYKLSPLGKNKCKESIPVGQSSGTERLGVTVNVLCEALDIRVVKGREMSSTEKLEMRQLVSGQL